MGYTTKFNGHFEVNPCLKEEHFAFLTAYAARDHRDDIPETPGYHCQWIPSSESTIEWDGNEKFYDYVEWLRWIIEKYLEPWGYELNGRVSYSGEEIDDFGTITVVRNEVKVKRGITENHDRHDKIRSLVNREIEKLDWDEMLSLLYKIRDLINKAV